MSHSDSTKNLVHEHLHKLEHLCTKATSCHVIIDAPHRRQRKGRQYEVGVELRVPGDALVVSENTGHSAEHQELTIALRDAFEALERQLKRWKQKRRGDVKHHAAADVGILDTFEERYMDDTSGSEGEPRA